VRLARNPAIKLRPAAMIRDESSAPCIALVISSIKQVSVEKVHKEK
jgi:hypothetical protein